MASTMKCCAAFAASLSILSPAYAGSCEHSITSVQAQVDAAIEKMANSEATKRFIRLVLKELAGAYL